MVSRLIQESGALPDVDPRIPVCTQYRLLFADRSYVFMFLAGSHIFGVLGAVGGTIVQEVTIWGQSEVSADYARTSDLSSPQSVLLSDSSRRSSARSR